MQLISSPHKNSTVLKRWQLGSHGARMGWSATEDDDITHLSFMFI